jgi:hypothetical protein
MPELPVDPWYGVHNGYEVQIDAGQDEWHCTGALYSLSKVSKRNQKPQGQWNTLDIQLDGQTTRVFLNGEQINEFRGDQPVPERKQWYEPVRGPRPDMGYIGLQNHDATSTIYFKEVSVQNGPSMPPQPVSKTDRERMLSYLHATRKMVLDATRDLTPAQWNYKPGPDRWSAAEIIEHLTLSESNLFGYALSGLNSKVAAPEKQGTDDELIARMKDRSQKAQAPENFRPSGKWKAGPELVDEFRMRRDRTILWMNDTQDDLRGKYVQTPGGTISVYQMLLIIPGHVERHLQQVAEVKNSAGYPKP